MYNKDWNSHSPVHPTIILSPHFCIPTDKFAIIHNGQQVGIIGEIHPQILVNHKIKKQRPCYFEIDEQTLYKGDAKTRLRRSSRTYGS